MGNLGHFFLGKASFNWVMLPHLWCIVRCFSYYNPLNSDMDCRIFSLACVCDLFACVCTGDLSLQSVYRLCVCVCVWMCVCGGRGGWWAMEKSTHIVVTNVSSLRRLPCSWMPFFLTQPSRRVTLAWFTTCKLMMTGTSCWKMEPPRHTFLFWSPAILPGESLSLWTWFVVCSSAKISKVHSKQINTLPACHPPPPPPAPPPFFTLQTVLPFPEHNWTQRVLFS